MVLKPERLEQAEAIFRKWELEYATIGTLTDTGNMVLKMHGEVVADLPVAPISGSAPKYDRAWRPTPKRQPIMAEELKSTQDVGMALQALLGCPDISSKRWIWEQYDHMVMNDTIAPPGGDAAVVRVHDTHKALAITTDVTPRYCFADPVEGGKQAVAETYRNLTAVGATPLAITNCLNFGNPEKPEIMGQIVGCLQGMGEACRILDYPVISGNVSLYNETYSQPILPTPTIGGVGLLKDMSRRVGSAITHEGDAIYMIGRTVGHMGSSLYLREIEGREEGAPPPVDLLSEKRHGTFIRQMIDLGLLRACHDVSDGGMLVAVAEMCLRKGIGVELNFPVEVNAIGYAFAEDQARYIMVVPQQFRDEVLIAANQLGVPITDLGTTVGDQFIVRDITRIPVEHLQAVNEVWLPGYMSM